jgi:eukaryotic-like serine/threonine-protein kinase
MKYCAVCNAKYDDGVSFCAVDGEVLEDDPTTIVDSTLDGQYHIESMLGKGGMGAVYRARHILLGDRVAIKVLPPQMRNNAEWLRRFRREGQAARRFRHPNAVTVYDLRTTNEGMIYMVMEYVEGRTLDAELRARGRFTPAEAFNVLEPVMSVLNAAHAQGVVHRDLKPENIMIGKPVNGQSVIKLLDLGIAKISEVAGSNAGGSTALTVAGQILGTPYYMSPEQWGEVPNDRNPEIDGRADIYSLGVVFYELVAGRRPFVGTTLQELRREHVSVMPRPLNEVSGDVPEEFAAAIARAMAKDRGDRLGTAGELAAELGAALGMPEMSASSMGTSSSNLQESRAASPQAVASEEEAAPQTVEVPEGRQTSSEIIAPTIVTMDSPPRADAGSPPPAATSLAQPPPASYGAQGEPPPASMSAPYTGSGTAAPMPTMMTNPATHSTDFQTPTYTPAPAAVAKKSSPIIPIIIGVLGLLLLVGAAGSYFVYKSLSGTTTTTDKPTEINKNSGSSSDKPAVATMAETLRYALEVETTQGGSTVRVAGVVPLASGQAFKFHFTPQEDGYLYVVGPGPGNVPMTFLTAKPVPQSGVKTNEASKGVDYSFPNGVGNWITLDKTPGTEDYTVIFSEEALDAPAFLNDTAGRALTATEQADMRAFEDKYKANAPKTDVVDGSGQDPFVSVKMPQAEERDEPVIFKIRIEHK